MATAVCLVLYAIKDLCFCSVLFCSVLFGNHITKMKSINNSNATHIFSKVLCGRTQSNNRVFHSSARSQDYFFNRKPETVACFGSRKLHCRQSPDFDFDWFRFLPFAQCVWNLNLIGRRSIVGFQL